MPFIVECPYCKLRARAPDRALGSSGQCSRCGNSFTLVPADDQEAPEPAEVSTGSGEASRTDNEANASAAKADGSGVKVVDSADAADVPAIAAPRHVAPSHFAAVAGAAALLSGALALVCAALSSLCSLVIPLSGLGFLAGATGIAMVCRTPAWSRWVLPIVGSTVSVAMLFVALAFPGLLGPTYQQSRQRAVSAPAVLRAVPIAAGGSFLSEAPEWVDASKYAVQWGDLRVQVVSVSSGPAPGKDIKDVPKGKAAKMELLVIRIRMLKSSPFQWKENRRPTLTDMSGKSLALRERELAPSNPESKSGSPMYDEVVTYEAPAKGWESVRLQVPAEAWGVADGFRFTIPASMAAVKGPGPSQPPKTAK